MATARLNSALTGLRGRVGDLVYKQYGDKIVVTRVPQFDGKWSAAQKCARERFAAASRYAMQVQRTPTLRARYEKAAAKRGLTVRSLAIAEYLKRGH